MPRDDKSPRYLAEAKKIAAEAADWPEWKKAGFQVPPQESGPDESAIRADERAKVEAEVKHLGDRLEILEAEQAQAWREEKRRVWSDRETTRADLVRAHRLLEEARDYVEEVADRPDSPFYRDEPEKAGVLLARIDAALKKGGAK